ncbi:hypothetical protein ACQCN2_05650 [Brevibacillus ginsengisoli]|uniref:hypothetical protein n=1 Tax=Brevibacillus ginsengisoli TaxID=363854 RepID=UPI003CF4F92E
MRKWLKFDKWVIAALLYVAVVIGGFQVYDQYFADKTQIASAMKHEGNQAPGHSEGSHEESGHDHQNASGHEGTSEVTTFVQSNGNEIKIFLKDKTGNPVNDLVVNHEKLLHFIIVDDHLNKFYHVHPEQIGQGEFRVQSNLPEGFYKAFIDIKPKNLAYHVVPVPFVVGNPSGLTDSHHDKLKPDNQLFQTIDGETVKLKLSSTQANQPITLMFDLDKTKLSPYLGAMGHVVILDENAQTFLHVHPANDQETIFETEFKQAGIYKIWAEFKQDGKVRAFPFVVEIEGGK